MEAVIAEHITLRVQEEIITALSDKKSEINEKHTILCQGNTKQGHVISAHNCNNVRPNSAGP